MKKPKIRIDVRISLFSEEDSENPIIMSRWASEPLTPGKIPKHLTDTVSRVASNGLEIVMKNIDTLK